MDDDPTAFPSGRLDARRTDGVLHRRAGRVRGKEEKTTHEDSFDPDRIIATGWFVLPGLAARIELSSLPAGDLTGADLVILSAATADKTVPMNAVSGAAGFGGAPVRVVTLSTAVNNTVAVGFGADPAVVGGIKASDKVRNFAYQTKYVWWNPSRAITA